MPADVTSAATGPSSERTCVEGAAHRGPIRDVDPVGDRLDALLAELGGALFGRLAVEVEQSNAVAVGPEPPGDAQADTRRGPGHDHNSAHAALPWLRAERPLSISRPMSNAARPPLTSCEG